MRHVRKGAEAEKRAQPRCVHFFPPYRRQVPRNQTCRNALCAQEIQKTAHTRADPILQLRTDEDILALSSLDN